MTDERFDQQEVSEPTVSESVGSEGAGSAGAAAGDGGVGSTEPPNSPVDPFAEVARQRDEYLDALQRLKAEFDNYRKRVTRDQQELAARAGERMVKELVPVLDDLERALEAASQHEEAKLEEGVALVHRSLAGLLAREGLSEVPTDGRFDPHVQEALLSQPSEADEGTVIQVLQKGYLLGDRVLRPARVVISSGPPQEHCG